MDANLRIILVIFPILLLSGCGDQCGNELVQTVISPNKSMAATVYLRSCGATTPFFTVVTLGEVRGQGGEVFEEDNVVFSAQGEIDVQLTWSSANQLHIIARTSDPYKFQKEGWENVGVKFN